MADDPSGGHFQRWLKRRRERARAKLQSRAAYTPAGPGIAGTLSLAVVACAVLFSAYLVWSTRHEIEASEYLLGSVLLVLASVCLGVLLSPVWMVPAAYAYKRRLARQHRQEAQAVQARLEGLYTDRLIDDDALDRHGEEIRMHAEADTDGAWTATAAFWLSGVGSAFILAGILITTCALWAAFTGWPGVYMAFGLPLSLTALGVGAAFALAGSLARSVASGLIRDEADFLRTRMREYLKLRRDAASK